MVSDCYRGTPYTSPTCIFEGSERSANLRRNAMTLITTTLRSVREIYMTFWAPNFMQFFSGNPSILITTFYKGHTPNLPLFKGNTSYLSYICVWSPQNGKFNDLCFFHGFGHWKTKRVVFLFFGRRVFFWCFSFEKGTQLKKNVEASVFF